MAKNTLLAVSEFPYDNDISSRILSELSRKRRESDWQQLNSSISGIVFNNRVSIGNIISSDDAYIVLDNKNNVIFESSGFNDSFGTFNGLVQNGVSFDNVRVGNMCANEGAGGFAINNLDSDISYKTNINILSGKVPMALSVIIGSARAAVINGSKIDGAVTIIKFNKEDSYSNKIEDQNSDNIVEFNPNENYELIAFSELVHSIKNIIIGIQDRLGALETRFEDDIEISKKIRTLLKMTDNLYSLSINFLKDIKNKLLSNINNSQDSFTNGDVGKLLSDLGLIAESRGDKLVRLLGNNIDTGNVIKKSITELIKLIERYGKDPHLITFDIRDELNFIAKSHLGNKKGVGVTIDTSELGEVTYVHGDELSLKNILRNLMTNALNYAPEGSRVTIKAKKISNDGMIEFSIIDEGRGIDIHQREKLFGIFQQSRDGKSNESGTGIGLYTVGNLVKANKGSIWIEDGFGGKGTKFKFTYHLPEVKGYIGSKEMNEKLNEGSTPNVEKPSDFRVLVADDNEEISNQIAVFLARFGYQVLVAQNSQEIIDILNNGGANMVIIDNDFKDNSAGGSVLSGIIKKKVKGIQVWANSASNDEDSPHVIQFKKSKVDGFFDKGALLPIKKRDIISATGKAYSLFLNRE